MQPSVKNALYYLSFYGVFKDCSRRWKKRVVKGRKLRHPLTLPLPDTKPLPIYKRKQHHPQQRCSPQTESIFCNLPLEIRRLIYAFVFGGKPVKRSSTIRTVDWHGGGHHHHDQTKPRPVQQRIQWVDAAPMALLQTCRQIYTEAIDVFYSNTVFKAFSPMDTRGMFVGIPAPRLDRIRSIWIDVRFSITCSLYCDGLEELFDEHTWEEAVQFFTQLPRLRDIRISFMKDEWTGSDYCSSLLERFVLPPLAAMTGIPKYEVLVNFEVQSPDGVPFRVKRLRAPELLNDS